MANRPDCRRRRRGGCRRMHIVRQLSPLLVGFITLAVAPQIAAANEPPTPVSTRVFTGTDAQRPGAGVVAVEELARPGREAPGAGMERRQRWEGDRAGRGPGGGGRPGAGEGGGGDGGAAAVRGVLGGAGAGERSRGQLCTGPRRGTDA